MLSGAGPNPPTATAGSTLTKSPVASRDPLPPRLRRGKRLAHQPLPQADTMTPEEFQAIQADLGLSDASMAKALGVTRQTVANWRTGHSGWKRGRLPGMVATALRNLVELRRLDPGNRKLPDALRRERRRIIDRSGSYTGGISNDNSPARTGEVPD